MCNCGKPKRIRLTSDLWSLAFIFLAVLLLSLNASAQPQILITPYNRGLLIQRTAAEDRAYLGIGNITGTNLIGNVLILAECNLGTIAGAATATLSINTNFYRATFSGSTFNVNLPAVPDATNWHFAQIVGTNTSGGTQIGTLKVANVATAMYNEALHEAVTTITNESGAAFTLTFRASNGIWKRVDVEGDGGLPSSGALWALTNGVIIPSPLAALGGIAFGANTIGAIGAPGPTMLIESYRDIALGDSGQTIIQLDEVNTGTGDFAEEIWNMAPTIYSHSMAVVNGPDTGSAQWTIIKTNADLALFNGSLTLYTGSDTNRVTAAAGVLYVNGIPIGGGGGFWAESGGVLFPSPSTPEIDFVNYADLGDSTTNIFWSGAVDDSQTFNQYGDLYFHASSTTGDANLSIDSVSGANATLFNLSLTPTLGQVELTSNQVRAFYVDTSSGYSGTGLRFLSDDGSYKPAGTNSSGATNTFAIINPSNDFVPYRTNATTLADSPIQRISSTSVGILTSGSSIILGNGEALIQKDNIGSSNPMSIYGVIANNSFIATSSLQQNSPTVTWQGEGWGTNTSTSQAVTFGSYIIPRAGAVKPTGSLNFYSAISNIVSPSLVFSVDVNSGYTGAGTLFLSDDGTYKAGGGAALWSSSGGVLSPSPAVDLVNITSQLADNATNVALIVDTAVPWTLGEPIVTFSDHGNPAFKVGLNFENDLVGDFTGALAIGYQADFNIGTSNAEVYDLGDSAGKNQTLSGTWNVFNIGDETGLSQVIVGVKNFTGGYYNFGDTAGNQQKVTNSSAIFNFGSDAGYLQSVTNGDSIFNYGFFDNYQSVIQDSQYCFNYGSYAGAYSVLTNCSWIYNYGESAGAHMHLTNSSYVYTFGQNSGANLSGTWEDVMLFGHNALPTQSDQMVWNVEAVGSGPIFLWQNGNTNTATLGFDGTMGVIHLDGFGSTPTISTNSGSGLGGATATITGSDLAGEITINTGLTPAVNASIVTINFNTAYGAAPYVVLWPSSATSSVVGFLPYVTSTTSGFSVKNPVALGLAGSTTYKYNFVSIQ